MKTLFVVTALALLQPAHSFADEMHENILSFIQADRLEYRQEPGDWLWDLQGWVGKDLHKFWWKTEGERGDTELQLLYSRAVAPFFDLQIGLRQDVDPGPQRSFATIGLQGLAPQWFEIDSALFIADNGKLSARFEAEYELLLTQRLVLQPRFELNIGAGSEPDHALGAGLRSLEFGLRLRYAVHRKFAPYIGIEWHGLYGGTAAAAAGGGEDTRVTTAVAGVRAWF
jgi:copper resistance protein B